MSCDTLYHSIGWNVTFSRQLSLLPKPAERQATHTEGLPHSFSVHRLFSMAVPSGVPNPVHASHPGPAV